MHDENLRARTDTFGHFISVSFLRVTTPLRRRFGRSKRRCDTVLIPGGAGKLWIVVLASKTTLRPNFKKDLGVRNLPLEGPRHLISLHKVEKVFRTHDESYLNLTADERSEKSVVTHRLGDCFVPNAHPTKCTKLGPYMENITGDQLQIIATQCKKSPIRTKVRGRLL